MDADFLKKIQRKVKLRNGAEEPLNDVATEESSLSELARGRYGEEGKNALRDFLLVCQGQELDSAREDKLKEWAFFESGTPNPLSRNVVLSSAFLKEDELYWQSPFVFEQDYKDSQFIQDVYREFGSLTLLPLVQSHVSNKEFPKELKEHAWLQLINKLEEHFSPSENPGRWEQDVMEYLSRKTDEDKHR